MASLRSFLSIPSPSHLHASAASVIRNLQSIPSDVKWERPEKLHITLKFFGMIEQTLLQRVPDELRKRNEELKSFMVTYSGLGAFPSMDDPRIFWIGADGGRDLLHLVAIIEEVCSSVGIPSEERPFHPHVTIGRVKGSRNVNRLTATAKSVTFEPIVARCSELCVMKSELHPTGSQHSVVESILLKL